MLLSDPMTLNRLFISSWKFLTFFPFGLLFILERGETKKKRVLRKKEERRKPNKKLGEELVGIVRSEPSQQKR